MRKIRNTFFTGIRCTGTLFVLALALASFTGCGSGSSSGKTPLSGTFTDSPVSGLTYQGDTLSGTTDVDGTFQYFGTDTVIFSIGTLVLGSATGNEQLSPIDLVAGAVDGTDPKVNNICVLLQTLDQDGNLNNGIRITTAIADIVSGYAIDFNQTATDFAADPNVAALLAELNAAGVFTDLDPRLRKLRSASEARDHLARTLSERKIVTTVYGQLRGYDPVANTVAGAGVGMWQFIGIPYAKPPVGDLRWKPPQPPETWTGVRDAVAWRDQSAQNPDMEPNGHGGMSEDCLYLNVTVPKNADNLPVMVWFHGGGFVSFSGNQWDFNNAAGLPAKGVVLVTVTHRLGPFGYLAHPLLTAESENNTSGNYGQLDLIAALEWVQDNIAEFGGDPDNVTIFGQSGGGAKVMFSMLSPLAKDLFHKAICISGTAVSTMATLNGISLGDAETIGNALFNRLEVTTLAEARARTWTEIIAQEPADCRRNYAPVIDFYYLMNNMENSIKNGLESDVPFIAGCTAADMEGLAPGLIEQMPWRSDFCNANQYAYKWSKIASGWQDRGILPGHTCDLSYVFNFPLTQAYYYLFGYVIDPATGERPYVGDLNGNGVMWWEGDMLDIMIDAGWDAADAVTADMIMTSWTNFARSGDPSIPGVIDWTPYTSANDAYLEIETTMEMKAGLEAAFN